MTPKITIWAMLSLSLGALAATGWAHESQPAGLTTPPPAPVTINGDDPAVKRVLQPSPILIQQPPLRPSERPGLADEWLPLDSLIVRPNIPAGDRYAFRITPAARRIEPVPPATVLTDYTLDAVQRAPVWLRADLTNNLSSLRGQDAEFFREMYAGWILDAQDPYVDEIAFTVAHTSSTLLSGGMVMPELVMENITTLYESDEYLDYVRIEDHGRAGDDDYWTTLVYNVRTAEGDTTLVELPPDYYYWFVMHPRLSDELPDFINPATGRPAAQPEGVFWRDYFLNHPDDGYQSLREALDSCGVLWGRLMNNSTTDNGAVGIVTRWIQDVMEFGSRQERPIQPVRIYRLHLGRCGEHSDITAAAARAALIPALCNMTFCNDHTWNEFWEGHWWSWEPTNNSVGDSLCYENGWGWAFPTVWDWRSDGWAWTVTDRYSEGVAILNVTVTSQHLPVDGAKVTIYSEAVGGGLQPAGWGYTDSNGRTSFKIGDARNIYVRAESVAGNYPAPANEVTRVVENSEAGATYDWDHDFAARLRRTTPEEADSPAEPTNHYRLTLDYRMLGETARGQIFNEAQFFAGVGDGKGDFFVCDEENYNRYLMQLIFQAFGGAEWNEAGQAEFVLPTDGVWYAVLANDNRQLNYLEAEVTARLTVDSDYWEGVAEETVARPRTVALLALYPNPFNSSTTITYDIARPGFVRLGVFDSSGRLVGRLKEGSLAAGRHSILWKADGQPSGSYLVRLDAPGGRSVSRGIVLMK